jgi:excisionase family DNA binding protein
VNHDPSRFGWVFSPDIKRKVPTASTPYGQDKAAGTNYKLKQRVHISTKIIYRWSIAQEYLPCQDGEILHDKSIVSALHPRSFCIYHRCFLIYTYSQGIYFQKYNQMEVTPMKEVPIWEKSNLTLEEAAAYSGIGINKLRTLTDNEHCQFVLWVGSKRLIKRRKLDEYTEKMFSL